MSLQLSDQSVLLELLPRVAYGELGAHKAKLKRSASRLQGAYEGRFWVLGGAGWGSIDFDARVG